MFECVCTCVWGGGGGAKMQLNDAANGSKFVRPDVTSAGLPLLLQRVREGREGGLIY